MQKKYKAILIFTKIHKENDLFVKLLSSTDEIITGIVYGGLSKKKINLLQKGFYLNINVNYIINKPPSISVELTSPLISNIINDKFKLSCLLSTVSLINLSIVEGQKINNIYNLSKNFIETMVEKKKWINHYFIFLFNLLKTIGYQIDYKKNKEYKYLDLINLEFTNIKNNTTIKFPHLILKENDNSYVNYQTVLNVLKIFETIFFTNHLSYNNQYLPNQYLLFKKIILDYLNKNK